MLTPAEDFLARQVRETALFTDFTTFIDRIRGERPSPRLQDVDLMSEYVLARNMYIFDVLPGDPAFKIRFVGSAICNFFGFDPTGRFLEGLDFVESFDATIAGYHTIVREREPHAFLNHIAFHEPRLDHYKKGQNFVMIRLAFPLVDDDGAVGNIVGIMDFLDPADAPEDRFVQLPYSIAGEAD